MASDTTHDVESGLRIEEVRAKPHVDLPETVYFTVVSVTPGSNWATIGIQPGDVIFRAGDTTFRQLTHEQRMAAINDLDSELVVNVNQGADGHYTAVFTMRDARMDGLPSPPPHPLDEA